MQSRLHIFFNTYELCLKLWSCYLAIWSEIPVIDNVGMLNSLRKYFSVLNLIKKWRLTRESSSSKTLEHICALPAV